MWNIESSLFLPLFISALLFFIGLFGVLTRKNILIVLMSLELMLQAVNINFVAFSKAYGFVDGPPYIFFIMTLAAAEAGVGLALAVRAYKLFKSIRIDEFNRLKE